MRKTPEPPVYNIGEEYQFWITGALPKYDGKVIELHDGQPWFEVIGQYAEKYKGAILKPGDYIILKRLK